MDDDTLINEDLSSNLEENTDPNLNTGEGTGQETNTQTSEFDPATFELNFKGQKVYPKDRDHLVALAQKGWSYDTRMEALKKQASDIEAMKSKYSQYDELDSYLKANPHMYQKLFSIINEQQEGTGEQGELHPEIHSLKSELNELKKWRQEYINKSADSELDKELSGLKSKYPDQKWDLDDGNGTLTNRIMQHAYDNGIPNLETAYRDYMWDAMRNSSKSEALRNMALKRQNEHKKGIILDNKTNQAPPSANNYNPNDSYNDLKDKALKELS